MVRIVTGESWKLNPSYLASLKLVSGRAPRVSTAAILDVLGIEIDGVNFTQGMSEAAIFSVVDELTAIVLRLCRHPSGGGQVSLCDGSVELVLGRRGSRASLSLVSLARPARVISGELEVDLSALSQATADCAQQLLADLAGVNEALQRTGFARRLAGREQLLRKAVQLSGRRRERPTEKGPLTPEPFRPPAPDVPSLGFTLYDEEGRLGAYRKGGDLYSLLGPGEVVLRDAQGESAARSKGPPFLVLTDLARAASDLMAAHEAHEKIWEGALEKGGSGLKLDLAAAQLAVEGRTLTCGALHLARAFLHAALDFGGAVVARNPAQAKNPYLCTLVDGAREGLEHLGELEGGDVFSDAGEAPQRQTRTGSAMPLGSGTLKRLRFKVAWRGSDIGGRAGAVRLEQGSLVVLGERRVAVLDAATGDILTRRVVDTAVFGESGPLISDRARLMGLDWRGVPTFLRDQPGHDHPQLTASAGAIEAGPRHQQATVCLMEGCRLTAIFSASGRSAWHFHAPQATRLWSAAIKNRVWAAADNGFLYALDATLGQVIFRVRAGCTFEGGLAIGGGVVASLGRQGGALWLAAVDAASGRPRLARPLPLSAASLPLPFQKSLVLGGISEGESRVMGFSLAGDELFKVSLGAACGVPALVAHAGRIYASLRDGSVACIAPDGTVTWKAPPCGLELDHALMPVVRRGVLLAAGDPMRALDPKTGAVLCELPPTQGLSAFTVGPRLAVHAIDDDGVAACYQLATHLSVIT